MSNSPEQMQANYCIEEDSPMMQDLNQLASRLNVSQVNEDDSQLIQILYSKVDENINRQYTITSPKVPLNLKGLIAKSPAHLKA